MRRKSHLRLLGMATLVWAGFLAAGLPDYYRQYSTGTMVLFTLAILVPITGAVYLVLRGKRPHRRMKVACWLAFYFTLPLAIYDGLFCGLYLGHGWRFLTDFWYLSVYYVIPWVVMPAVALLLGREDSRGR